MGGADEFQQQAQAFVKVVCAGKVIGGHVVAGEGIAGSAVGGELRADVPASRQIEHFMLQIVGDSGGNGVFPPLKPEMGMDGAEIRDEIGLLFGKARLGHHRQPQPVGQDLPVNGLVQLWVACPGHWLTPFRKQVLCSVRLSAARVRSSGVTASRAFLWACGSRPLPPRTMEE